jgi:hypothetical protein
MVECSHESHDITYKLLSSHHKRKVDDLIMSFFLIAPGSHVLRFGYLGKWSPCAYEFLSTKGEDYYPCTLLYDSNFTLT